MNYEAIIVIAGIVYLAGLLLIAIAILVMEFRSYRQMYVDDRILMLALRRGNEAILDELRRAGSEKQ